MSSMRLDLHVHTVASDGTVTPQAVVDAAVRGRLDVLSITDHDTTAGAVDAIEHLGDRPLQIIPGIEVSSTRDGDELHILGYFVDPVHPAMLRHRERAGNRRTDRMMEMLDRLSDQGVEVDYEQVVDAAGADHGSIGRPHLARALVNEGVVNSMDEAFHRWIGNAHPAFVPTALLTPVEAIALIVEAGGIPIWAHPPYDRLEPLLPEFVEAGLRGIEVYRPRTRPNQVVKLEAIARAAGVLVSGGSDWHGPEGGAQLGDFYVNSDEVRALLEIGGL